MNEEVLGLGRESVPPAQGFIHKSAANILYWNIDLILEFESSFNFVQGLVPILFWETKRRVLKPVFGR